MFCLFVLSLITHVPCFIEISYHHRLENVLAIRKTEKKYNPPHKNREEINKNEFPLLSDGKIHQIKIIFK